MRKKMSESVRGGKEGEGYAESRGGEIVEERRREGERQNEKP